MTVIVYYDVAIKPGRMADFLAKEPGGHDIARRLGADDPFIARDVDDDHHVLVSFSFADRAAYDAFTSRAAEDEEAIEYNRRAVSPDNPSQILGVRLVETFAM
ncbi:MAG: hypothetical protein ABIQ73_30730 [Acidimicrobiales bacterium]